MEEFADTFQQAQCAILHAQRDLIALRRLQDEPHAGDVTDASVGLQVSSQARQEEALLYLERGARILCGLLQGGNAGGAPQEAGSMDAAKRAMRRYFEGQHEVQRRREEEFERLLTERGSELAAAQDAAVRFVQRASLRRLGMRMLGRWIQRTIIASADRRQVEVRRQFTKARDGIACRHAKMRSNRELRARCFYRWNAKRLEVALEARRNREMELEEELQRSQRDLQRAERELQRHMSREMSWQDRAHNAISCVEQELEEEVVRLKRAMDEMAYEFSERTSNYVRQQEELARHYTERERRLTLKVITAEDLKREEEQHSAHLASVVTAQEVSFASMMDTTFDTLEDCIMAKVNLLHAASLAVVHETAIRGTELTEQLTELMEQVELVAPLSEHVVQLQGRCDHAERRLEEMSLANKQQMSNLHQREMLMAGSLQRTQDVSRMRRIWNTWQLYMIRHRSARVQKKMHVELDEAHKAVWSRVEEWKEREHRRAMDFLLEDEVYSRRCVIELENATRESLVNQTGRRTTETFMRAELASEERQCAELREDVGKLTGQVKYWKQMAVDLQLIQLQKGHEARLQRLAVMEHEERLSLCYEEFCEQQSIQQGIYALGVGASLQKQQQAMRVKLGTAEQELQGMGCLLVEYCAQNVFSRWMLFVRKRKEQKTKKHMATIANAAASWFSNSTAWVTRIHDMKLDLFFSHSHQVNGGFATTTRLFAAKVEAVKMEMKNTRSVCNRQVYTDISRYGTLWAEFTKTAANWCADRENLLLNFCQDVVSTTVAPIEKAMRLLSAERSLMAEHVQTVVKEMRLTTTETLAAQQERYDVVINELLQYQAFLENRIASAGVVEDIELQRKIREEHEACEARAREDMAAMARRIESLQEALKESDRHHEERRRHHEEEVAVLRYRLERQEENAQRSVAEMRSQHAQQVVTLQRKIEELQNASAERHIALDGIVRQYQHILSTFEEELASRCDTFLTAATMLVEVERFSEELLRRSQLDLQHFSKVRQYENEIATLTGALQSARKQLEVKCCEMREEHEACEARAREDMAAMERRIESLQEALRESDRHHEERRRHHEEEVTVLRYRLERQEENAQRSVAEMRSQHAQQVATLQRKIEELQNASAERHIAEQEEVPTSHEGKEQEHVCELELVVQCLKCELQEAEGRCTLMCEELQGLLTANCVMHRAVVAMTRRLLQATEPSSMTYFCQHLLDGVSHFAGTASLAASDLVDAKSRLFVACSVGPVSGERHRASFSPTVSRHSRRSVSTDDVMRSMLRYSKMLNEQRYKNDARVRRLDVLVTQFDDLIERGRAVTRLEGGTLTT